MDYLVPRHVPRREVPGKEGQVGDLVPRLVLSKEVRGKEGRVVGGIPLVELKNTKCSFQVFFLDIDSILKILKI